MLLPIVKFFHSRADMLHIFETFRLILITDKLPNITKTFYKSYGDIVQKSIKNYPFESY